MCRALARYDPVMGREPSNEATPPLPPWDDSEWRAAVDEVDDSLLDWFLSLTPLERVEAATKAADTLSRFVHEHPKKD